MKYYSEVLDDFFDTEKELIDAETEQKEKDALDGEKEKTEKEVLKQKVDEAQARFDAALIKLDEAKKEVNELQKKYDEEIELIDLKYKELTKDTMRPAEQELASALVGRDEALYNYNKKYGPYVNVYKDKEALDKAVTVNNIFNKFFSELGL